MNPEVLAVNQDPLGLAARRRPGLSQDTEVGIKALNDGSLAAGLFNRGDKSAQIVLPWRNVGLRAATVRDLWLRKDLGRQEEYVVELAPHGCVLLKARLAQ